MRRWKLNDSTSTINTADLYHQCTSLRRAIYNVYIVFALIINSLLACSLSKLPRFATTTTTTTTFWQLRRTRQSLGISLPRLLAIDNVGQRVGHALQQTVVVRGSGIAVFAARCLAEEGRGDLESELDRRLPSSGNGLPLPPAERDLQVSVALCLRVLHGPGTKRNCVEPQHSPCRIHQQLPRTCQRMRPRWSVK